MWPSLATHVVPHKSNFPHFSLSSHQTSSPQLTFAVVTRRTFPRNPWNRNTPSSGDFRCGDDVTESPVDVALVLAGRHMIWEPVSDVTFTDALQSSLRVSCFCNKTTNTNKRISVLFGETEPPPHTHTHFADFSCLQVQ